MYPKKIKRCISIVDKLNYRSVTAQKLGVHVHTRLSARLHLCWNITCILSHRNCMERVFISKEEWKKFCGRLSFAGLDGICVRVRGEIKPAWDWKVGPCLYTERRCLVKPVGWRRYCLEYLIPEKYMPMPSPSVIS